MASKDFETKGHAVNMANNYAFIGLGAMGYAMAGNIRRRIPADAILYVYDVFRPSLERFAAEFSHLGPISIVDSAREAAETAAVIISIVPAAQNVREVYLDPRQGVIAAEPNSNRLVLECSTIESAEAKSISTALTQAQAGQYVDTPVSGGVPAAINASLAFMIGHAQTDTDRPPFARIHEVLSWMGKPEKLFWCGQLGAGLAAKISNNYLSCTILLVIAEAMAIGVRSGIDPKLLQDVIHNSSGQTFMGDHVNPVPGVVDHAPSSNDWKLGFKTQMMIKDIGLGVAAGIDNGIQPTMAQAALEVWKKAAQDPRCIDRDGSSVWLYINDLKS